MAKERAIATPASRRIRQLRLKLGPVVIWAAAVAVIFVLQDRRTTYVDEAGLVEPRSVVVSTLEAGVVQGMSVEFLDSVTAGATLGLMDPGAIEAELKVAAAELGQLRAELAAGRKTLDLNESDRRLAESKDYRRFLVDAEEARLDVLAFRIEQEVNKVELEQVNILRVRQRRLAETNILDQQTFEDIDLEYQAIAKAIDETEKMLAFALDRSDELVARAEQYEGERIERELEPLVGPLVESLSVQEARIESLQLRREQRVLRAPASGVVSQIFHRAGDTVMAGTPLLEITPSEADTVVAYLSVDLADGLRAGAPVEIISGGARRVRHDARVAKVGRSVEEMPAQLRRSQRIVQWGVPVVVSSLVPGVLRPGEVVTLRFRAK